jgi:Domain of unknown function (DUF4388)
VALKGTLKDFGIAEILQLIGQQAKSGVLHLESRDDVIHIAMADGSVVRAESAGRKAREKLGMLLVRAELINRQQLDYALDLQKRTLRRLGDILVELGYLTVIQLREMTALQTTETVYKLFHWKSGTYAFEPGDVEWDPETVTPIRAESVLMEGFRQVDEWPLVRKRISSMELTFERVRVPEPERARTGSLDRDVDAAFDSLGDGTGRGDGAESDQADLALGRGERRAFELAVPGRTVEQIVDLSRLGEFETCKALRNLINLEYLRAVTPARARGGAVGAYARDLQHHTRTWLVRGATTGAIAVAIAGLAFWVDQRGIAVGDGGSVIPLRDNVTPRFLARYQLARLRGALDVFRVEKGQYPERLEELVEVGLVGSRDLRHPWIQPYHYRRRPDGGFVLLSPVE